MRVRTVVAELKVRPTEVGVKTEEQIRSELVALLIANIEDEIDKLCIMSSSRDLDNLGLKYKIKVSFVDPREN